MTRRDQLAAKWVSEAEDDGEHKPAKRSRKGKGKKGSRKGRGKGSGKRSCGKGKGSSRREVLAIMKRPAMMRKPAEARAPSAEEEVAEASHSGVSEEPMESAPVEAKTPSSSSRKAKTPKTRISKIRKAKTPKTCSSKTRKAKTPKTPSSKSCKAKTPKTPSSKMRKAKTPKTKTSCEDWEPFEAPCESTAKGVKKARKTKAADPNHDPSAVPREDFVEASAAHNPSSKVKKTFARRYEPQSGFAAQKWHTLKDVYEDIVKPYLEKPSTHEDAW